MKTPLLLAGLLLAAPAPAAPAAPAPATCPAGPGSQHGCAPPGLPLPRLTLAPNPGGGRLRMLFRGGPELAFGSAWLFLESPTGHLLPAGPCTGGLRGRLVGPFPLDAGGAWLWTPSPGAMEAADCLRVVAWAAGAPPSQGVVSNTLALPPHDRTGGQYTVGGSVVVTEFLKDPSHVSDSSGEWIELYNRTPLPIDVEGWTLSDLGSELTVLANGGQGMVIPPGGYVVLGRSTDRSQNGGVPVDFGYSSFTLSNADDEIVLADALGTLIDLVAYDDGVAWPDLSGRSISLAPGKIDATTNDDGASWCPSSTPISVNNPDTGTPGQTNDVCP